MLKTLGSAVTPGIYPGNSSSIVTITGVTYTLQSSDNGKTLIFTNASAISLNLALLSVGFICRVIQEGAGRITVLPGSFTLRSFGSFTISMGQFAVFDIQQTATSVFYLSGNVGS